MARKSKLYVRAVVLTVLVIFPGLLKAQETSAPATTAAEGATQIKLDAVKPEAQKKKFGIDAQIEGSTNLREASDYESSRETSYAVTPSLRVSDDVKLTALVTFVQDLKEIRNSDFKNTEISAVHDGVDVIPEKLKYRPSVHGVLPTNTESRETTSYLGGVGTVHSLAFSFDALKVPTTLTYGLGARRNFHEYNRSNEGEYNNEYRFSNSAKLDVDLGKKFSFSTRGTLFSSLTYNSAWRSKFEVYEEIGYDVTETFNLTVGHVNTDNTLKSNMNESNLAFFNDNTSSVYLDLTVTY